MTHALLFEVGTEELPPSELPTVLQALEEGAGRALTESRLAFESLRVVATPRRLALAVSGLAPHQTAQRLTVTGPPMKAAFDAEGRPTKAAEGFARSQGVGIDRLTVIPTERGEYAAVERTEAGRPAAEILGELLPRLVSSLPFSKQMRWGAGDVRFVRPIRWVVALLDAGVLPLAVCGVTADRVTYGHRFLRPEPIVLSEPGEYPARLERAFVIPDVTARRDMVRDQVESAAAASGHRARVDAATLETVVHLVEYPVAVVGTFAETYLKLPREVVETPIRRHQKCFPVETPGGELAPLFVTVSNMPGADPAEIRRGNERVIGARLADADFYFREDLKVAPADRLPRLAGMVFHERLGSLLEKTERVTALAEHLASGLDPVEREALRRAARLAKSDLPSGMVREFPELQGVIGEEYALRAGEPPAVALAIREHYLPRSADDGLPRSLPGAILSVADKVDSVVGCVAVGLVPTGSQDPYALRRQAQGIVQIALGRPLRFSLEGLVDRALALVAGRLVESPEATRERVLEFFRLRLATTLASRGLRADVVEAVLSSGFDDIVQATKRAEALTTLMGRPDWEPLVITFKRTINILPLRAIGAVDPTAFVDDAERRLHVETEACRPRVRAALDAEDFAKALSELAALRPLVDRFFDAVLVMDRDPAIQENRLALVKAIADLVLPVGDLRRIQPAA